MEKRERGKEGESERGRDESPLPPLLSCRSSPYLTIHAGKVKMNRSMKRVQKNHAARTTPSSLLDITSSLISGGSARRSVVSLILAREGMRSVK